MGKTSASTSKEKNNAKNLNLDRSNLEAINLTSKAVVI